MQGQRSQLHIQLVEYSVVRWEEDREVNVNVWGSQAAREEGRGELCQGSQASSNFPWPAPGSLVTSPGICNNCMARKHHPSLAQPGDDTLLISAL